MWQTVYCATLLKMCNVISRHCFTYVSECAIIVGEEVCEEARTPRRKLPARRDLASNSAENQRTRLALLGWCRRDVTRTDV